MRLRPLALAAGGSLVLLAGGTAAGAAIAGPIDGSGAIQDSLPLGPLGEDPPGNPHGWFGVSTSEAGVFVYAICAK